MLIYHPSYYDSFTSDVYKMKLSQQSTDSAWAIQFHLLFIASSVLSDLLADLGRMDEGDLPKDHLTYLQRCLKSKLMTQHYDPRGSRRTALICNFIQVNIG